MLTISFLVPTLGNRIKELKRLLNSLEQQTIVSFEIVIVVQDNYEEVKYICNTFNNLKILCIKSEKRGLSINRNIGLSYCSGEIIVLSDDDCWDPENAVQNISKEFKVMFDTSDDNDLIIKMLKLKDNVVKDNLGIKAYKGFSKKVRATIFFEKVETEADKALKLAQIEMLKKSIQRRKNLLSNEGYVTKAPQNIVEQERKNLALEEEKLKNLELDNK